MRGWRLRPWVPSLAEAGASRERTVSPGRPQRAGHRDRGGYSRHAPLREDFKPSATANSLPRPRRAPATGGGPRIIGRVARKRVLIGRSASRPRFSARRRLHFVGRDRRRRSVETLRWPAARSSVLVGFAVPLPRLSLEGEGASKPSRSRRRRSPGLEVGEWRRRDVKCGHVGGGAPYCWGKEARSEAGGRGRPGGAGSRAGLEARSAWEAQPRCGRPELSGSLWE